MKASAERTPAAVDDDTDPEDGPDGERTYTVRAVERVCSVLNLLQESTEGISLVEVATATGLPKASAFRYLWTLEMHRYVERDPVTGLYRFGLAFLPLQARQLDLLRQQAKMHMEKLRDEFGETVNLGLLDSGRVIYLDIVESSRSVRLAARTGDRDEVHSTALGKAIAAFLPESQVRSILAREGMPKRTRHTITDPEVYLQKLAKVRADGYALDDRENEADGRCIAVPMNDLRLPAALSVSAPVSRLPLRSVPTLVAALTRTASSIIADLRPMK